MVKDYVDSKTCNDRFNLLRGDIKELDVKLDKLMSNDFPHIKTDIALLKAKQGINGDKEVSNVRSWKDTAKENTPWFGVVILVLVEIIQVLING